MDDQLQEILRRVRRLELRSRGRVREELAGQYHSSFRGQGIDFAEHRAYLPGDEVRNIDWNVTARMQDPYIRTFTEERELLVYLLVDVSPSTGFGSVRMSKRELAAEVAATLAFSALRNNDKVGLILFSRDVELVLPAARGRPHVLRLLREILHWPGAPGKTRPAAALDGLRLAVPRRALVFLISDMAGEDFAETLKPVARKHDVIAISLHDPAEANLPDVGLVCLEDTETGESVLVDTSDPKLRQNLAASAKRWRGELDALFSRAGCEHLVATTDGDFLPSLHALLRKRSRHPR